LVIAVAALVRRLGSETSTLPVTAEWIDELSADRYRPMIRLLDGRDIQFLRAQPGFTRAMESDLRPRRCQIMRDYLRCLDLDFNRVATALGLLMVQSEQERPQATAALMEYRLRYEAASAVVRARLFLYRWGIGTVDAAPLVRVFDAIRVELRQVMPSAVPACA
jgi:hypothetical protein